VVDFLYESSNFKDVIQKSLEIKEPNDSLSKGDRRKVLKFLRDEDTMKTIGETFKSIDCQKEFELKIVKVVSFDEEAKKLPATFEVQIKTNIRKNDWDEKILPIWKKIFNDVPLTKFRTQLILSEALSIKKGSECHNCKKQFQPADPQYHCYECQLWFCEECGEKVDKNKKGSNSMIHPHNLIWIDVKEEKDIPLVDRYKLGDNRTYEDNFLQRGFGCNGCGEGSDKRVYICLNCRPGMLRSGGYIDICEECFKKLKKKEMNEEEKNARQMVVNRLKGDEHDENTHLLLRVCFGDNYYDF
jgi:predicted amidophosphoribosyltransferase